MKLDLSGLSKKRKAILSWVGIIYNIFLFFMLAFGFKLRDLIGMTVFALVLIGILFLRVE